MKIWKIALNQALILIQLSLFFMGHTKIYFKFIKRLVYDSKSFVLENGWVVLCFDPLVQLIVETCGSYVRGTEKLYNKG